MGLAGLDGVGWSTCKNRGKQVRVRVAYEENERSCS